MRKHLSIWSTVLIAVLALLSQTAKADSINTTLNLSFGTAALQGQGAFEMAFLLTDGSGAGDQNTTIQLTNFQFGAGGFGGGVTTDSTGGFAGNLAAGASLIDSSFFNLFGANFTPGSQLAFKLSIVSSSLDSPTPDLLELVILDLSGNPVFTTDPSGQNTLITANLDSANPSIQTFAVAVPEPGSMIQLIISLAAVVLLRRKWLKLFSHP
jgi:hypothetical protein